MVDRHQQTLGVDTKFTRDQVPGKLDGALLEIVAEREIPEHFEEGMMARGVADIIEVVMLAARAHAFLRRSGRGIRALLETRKDVLELDHAGIREHQRRIVARNERARRHDRVAVRLEIVEECRPYLVYAAHVWSFVPALPWPLLTSGSGRYRLLTSTRKRVPSLEQHACTNPRLLSPAEMPVQQHVPQQALPHKTVHIE